MKNKRYLFGTMILASSVSLFAHAELTSEKPSTFILNETCVLALDTNNTYSCKTSEQHFGNSTVNLNFSELVLGENFPPVIECKWLENGRIKNNPNSGGGYTVAKMNNETFRLYKQSDETQPNVIGVSFQAIWINGVSISCSPL